MKTQKTAADKEKYIIDSNPDVKITPWLARLLVRFGFRRDMNANIFGAVSVPSGFQAFTANNGTQILITNIGTYLNVYPDKVSLCLDLTNSEFQKDWAFDILNSF